MFPLSSQCQHWMFPSESAILDHQVAANERYIKCSMSSSSLSPADFLTFEECLRMLQFFTQKLQDFCKKFQPPMPHCVQGTAVHYFKRFYVHNSVMDYHPKDILVTAAYLACKVEEFNVSMEQFLSNVHGNKERASEIILNNELLLMKELNFHLMVHNPYTPVEGIILDLKNRGRKHLQGDSDHLRPRIEQFLADALLSNACLLFAPSQIALAAVIHSAGKAGFNLDTYVTHVLFNYDNDDDEEDEDDDNEDRLRNIVDAVKNIRLMAKTALANMVDTATMKPVMEKLEKCRNEDNNPDTQAYKRKYRALLEEEEDALNTNAKVPKFDS